MGLDSTPVPEFTSGEERNSLLCQFAVAVRSVRTIAGVTQERAACAVGVTRSAWANYETATRLPASGTLSRLSVWAGVEPLELVSRAGARALSLRAADVAQARRRALRRLIRQAVVEHLIDRRVARAWARAAGIDLDGRLGS